MMRLRFNVKTKANIIIVYAPPAKKATIKTLLLKKKTNFMTTSKQ